MLHAALLIAALTVAGNSAPPEETSIARCFESMDGAVYHGDPTDRALMRANVHACERGLTELSKIRAGAAHGPEKLYLTARILDRAATLSFMGLDDARAALPEVRAANLYFRIASALPRTSPDYRAAAAANARLTAIQLQTLHTEIAAQHAHSAQVASLNPRHPHRAAPAGTTFALYHKL
jgi:hypothetical protein